MHLSVLVILSPQPVAPAVFAVAPCNRSKSPPRRHLRLLSPKTRDTTLSDTTTSEATDDAMNSRLPAPHWNPRTKPLSETTERDYITLIAGVFKWAKAKGYVSHNPLAEVEKPAANTRQEFVKFEDWGTLIGFAIGQPFKDYVTVMLYTGASGQNPYAAKACTRFAAHSDESIQGLRQIPGEVAKTPI